MDKSPFQVILEEIAKTQLMNLISSPTSLSRLVNNMCLIPLTNGLKLQAQLDDEEKNLLVATVIGNLQVGKYRDLIFKEALKANGLPPPLHGIFAYSKKTSDLLLFDFLDMRGLTGNIVSERLVPFIEKAKIWSEALSTNNIPESQPVSGSGIFGLR